MKPLTPPVQECYRLISEALKDFDPSLARAFEERTKTHDPRDLYFWLEGLGDEREFPPEMEPLLTDLFYLLH